MILYNTLTGFLAGAILLTAASLARRDTFQSGHTAVLAICGVPLTVLSLIGAITWPLTANPPVNIAFWEPSLMLGILATAGAVVLLRHGGIVEGYQPVAWLVAGVGLILVTIASAIFSYRLIGDAPTLEPITGQFQGWENTAFGVTYLLAGIGCLVAPWWHRPVSRQVMRWSWLLSGIFFTAFSILNYRTHIGLLINIGTGSHYQW